MIRVGILGFGYAAQTFHVPLIRALAPYELTAIYSSQAEKHQAEQPEVQFFNSPESLINSDIVDLIIVTSPNDTHFKIAQDCLLAGKHVVLEKPMVTRVSEAVELEQLAKAQGKHLSVFHNRRWDGDFLTLQKIIAENRVGNIRFFESHFDRFRPVPRVRWREQAGEGTGIWYDLGPHLIDQSLQLFGMPLAITAHLKQLRERAETCDYFRVALHYSDKEVVLQASPFMAAPNPRFVLAGDRGTYVKHGLDPQEEQLKAGFPIASSEFGVEDSDFHGTLYTEDQTERVATIRGDYAIFFNNLAVAITRGEDASVKIPEVIQGLKIIAAGTQSHIEEKTIYLKNYLSSLNS